MTRQAFPFHRTIGFDTLSDFIDRLAADTTPDYPPYNIEKLDENSYAIYLAVAGFASENIVITSEGESLKITGTKPQDPENKTYLHKGIATRSFNRQFQLAPHMQVTNATMEHGLLRIDLKRQIPDALKPRQIPIEIPTQIENA